jgi:hypothetical protein
MKTSRKAFFWAILVSLMFVVSVNNLYAADCASATIKRLGTNPVTGSTGASPYMVQLDCSADTIWPGTLTLYLSEDLGDSGLATLLTAYSLGKTVWVRTLGVTAGSIISVIYIND